MVVKVPGFFSLVVAADTVLSSDYWMEQEISTAYEPAIQHAAETGELEIKTVHLDYRSELEDEEYLDALEDTMEELPGLEEASASLERLEPGEKWLPGSKEDIHSYSRPGSEPGVRSLMHEIEDERDAEHQILNLLTPPQKNLGAGGVDPDIEGTAYIADTGDTRYLAEATAHEDAHILGIGHTLSDGMSNAPLGRIYASTRDDFFGPKSKEWWQSIAEEYR
jgi:hypothetical protein